METLVVGAAVAASGLSKRLVMQPSRATLPSKFMGKSVLRVTTSTNLKFVLAPQKFRRLTRPAVAETAPGKTEELDQAAELSDDEETEEETEVKEEVVSNSAGDTSPVEEEKASLSVAQSLIQDFREAIAVNDEAALAEVEAQLETITSERDSFAKKVSTLTEEISTGKDRFLRLNADFDNYRKRSERDRLAVAGNVRGEVIGSLLPMVDNFERAKTSIKTETEGEQKIDNSYQGIYKQFVEIMKSLGVVAVDTVGKEFDPNLHEAIMREESQEYAEDIVTQEFRRGFAIGDRLLRPAMVKVSSGPGPAAATPDLPVEESLSSE